MYLKAFRRDANMLERYPALIQKNLKNPE